MTRFKRLSVLLIVILITPAPCWPGSSSTPTTKPSDGFVWTQENRPNPDPYYPVWTPHDQTNQRVRHVPDPGLRRDNSFQKYYPGDAHEYMFGVGGEIYRDGRRITGGDTQLNR